MTAVHEQVYDIIAKEGAIDRARIRPEATMKDLEVESLDVVQIIAAIEEQFGVFLPYDDPSFDIQTAGGLCEAVERLLRHKQTA